MNRGLLFSLIVFFLLCAAIVTDALLVDRAIGKMEEALSSLDTAADKEEEEAAFTRLTDEFQRSRFLLSLSLPLSVIYEAEQALVALSAVEFKEAQKEKEALSLSLTQMRRITLPGAAQIF